MTLTYFFFPIALKWVKSCVTCTLNWKQNIDFSLSRISTGAFPPSPLSHEALHTIDKHWIPLQGKVLNSIHTKSSAGQLFYDRLLTEVIFHQSAFSVSFRMNNNVWGLLLCLVLIFCTFMRWWYPITKKKDYRKKLPHNNQVGATRRLLLKAKANILVVIQIHTNFSGSFTFEV